MDRFWQNRDDKLRNHSEPIQRFRELGLQSLKMSLPDCCCLDRFGAGNSQFENIDRDHVICAKMFGHETLNGDCNFRIALQLPSSKIDLSKRALGIHSKYFSPRDRKCLLRSIFISANNEYHIRFLLQRLSNNGKENGQLQFTIFRILSNKWKIKCFIHY